MPFEDLSFALEELLDINLIWPQDIVNVGVISYQPTVVLPERMKSRTGEFWSENVIVALQQKIF